MIERVNCEHIWNMHSKSTGNRVRDMRFTCISQVKVRISILEIEEQFPYYKNIAKKKEFCESQIQFVKDGRQK